MSMEAENFAALVYDPAAPVAEEPAQILDQLAAEAKISPTDERHALLKLGLQAAFGALRGPGARTRPSTAPSSTCSSPRSTRA
jgi:hypothetical protein